MSEEHIAQWPYRTNLVVVFIVHRPLGDMDDERKGHNAVGYVRLEWR